MGGVNFCGSLGCAQFLDYYSRSMTPTARICAPGTSLEASRLYHGIRYPNMDFCPQACSEMKINTINTAREKDWSANKVVFNFRKRKPVSREVLSYSLLSLVAEVSPCLCTEHIVTRLDFITFKGFPSAKYTFDHKTIKIF